MESDVAVGAGWHQSLIPAPDYPGENCVMKTRLRAFLFVVGSAIAASSAGAITIPAGTGLVVETTQSVTSHDRVGKTCTVRLAHDVVIGGKVALRTGTNVSLTVMTSLRDARRSHHLSLDLTSIDVKGRSIAVDPVEAYKLRPTSGRVAVYVDEHNYPHGTKVGFRLSKPIQV